MIRSICAAIGLTIVLVTPAMAGREILADQGNNYAGDGQSWPVTTTLAGVPQTLPFAIDVGGGPQSNLGFVTNANGSVSFTNGDFINIALYNQAWFPPFAISNDRGRLDPSLIDPTLSPNFSADPNTAGLDSYRFMWNGVCPTSSPRCTFPFYFEAVIVYLSPEAFVLQFNYGTSFSTIDTDPIAIVSVGFKLGTNTVPIITNGSVLHQISDYCFANGTQHVFSTLAECRGTPRVVPEPHSEVLLMIGGLGLAWTWRRRRTGRLVAAS